MELMTPQIPYLQIILLLSLLIPGFFFVFAQYKTLDSIRHENRTMAPWLVWLQFIPFLNFILDFFFVSNIATSLRREIQSRHNDSILGISDLALEGDKKPTFQIGIAYSVLWVVGYLVSSLLAIRLIGTIISLSSLVCWIAYWVQLVKYKKLISIGI